MLPLTLTPARWLALGGAALFAFAAIDLGVRYATLPDPDVVVVQRRVEVPVPAPAPAPVASTSAASVARTSTAPVAPASVEPCGSFPGGDRPETWTIDREHFGPFYGCAKATITRPFIEEAMPGFTVEERAHSMDPDIHIFTVRQRGKRYLELTVAPNRDDWPLAVTIYTRSITTPWRIHVGDTVKTLTSHHRDLTAVYAAAEGSESLWIQHDHHDGWNASFRYHLNLAPLGKDRSLLETADIPLAPLNELVIESIAWTPQSLDQIR